MGRYSAKKRQDAQRAGKKEMTRQAVEYTTAKGRGKNRVAAKATPAFKGPGGNPNGSGEGEAQKKPLKTIPASKRPKDMQAGKVYGDAGQPKALKLPAKPSAPKKTAPKTPAATSTKKLTPMQQWAKANPGLAKKVKKGQSGYKELKIGRSTKKRTWLDKNYKPGK